MDTTSVAGGPVFASTVARNLAVACAMAAMFMQTLDQTIANVALPHMQGGLAASRDQITWVLTSYIIATAIMTAPVGWLASRFGKRNCILVAVAGFTVSSALCGMAQNLDQIVVFRVLQGAFGAGLGPLSQTMMMDMFPPHKRGSVMGIWGMGVMLGPILGPTLGGYLTDSFSWRWVFYINVPVGIACVMGLLLFYRDHGRDRTLSFDWFGFSLLAIGLGALQLMLDRGSSEDWFSSTEILVEGVLALLGLYLFSVHMATSTRPFIRLEIFKDRNFTSATLLMFITGGMLVASSALLAPFLQTLGGYPVTDAGLLMMPRGVGTMLAMSIVGRIAMRFDPRKVITAGAVVLLATTYDMSTWGPAVSAATVGWVGFLQGFGMGFIFVPMNLIAFATIPPEVRTDASAMMNLLRNIGAAVSVTMTTVVLTRSMQIVHSQVAEHVDPFNRALGVNAPSMMWNPQMPFGLGSLDGMISRAALEIAYSNDFLFLFYISIPAVLLVWIMKRPELPGAMPPPRDALQHAD
ncbi:MAG: DHA2 family efflux MFS transporter permease subunit [Pseudomonadales bacterium]